MPPKLDKPIEPRSHAEDMNIPRNFSIERRDLEKHGFTPQCKGCYAAKHGRASKPHSDKCRERIRRLILDDEDQAHRVILARARLDTKLYQTKEPNPNQNDPVDDVKTNQATAATEQDMDIEKPLDPDDPEGGNDQKEQRDNDSDSDSDSSSTSSSSSGSSTSSSNRSITTKRTT